MCSHPCSHARTRAPHVVLLRAHAPARRHRCADVPVPAAPMHASKTQDVAVAGDDGQGALVNPLKKRKGASAPSPALAALLDIVDDSPYLVANGQHVNAEDVKDHLASAFTDTALAKVLNDFQNGAYDGKMNAFAEAFNKARGLSDRGDGQAVGAWTPTPRLRMHACMHAAVNTAASLCMTTAAPSLHDRPRRFAAHGPHV